MIFVVGFRGISRSLRTGTLDHVLFGGHDGHRDLLHERKEKGGDKMKENWLIFFNSLFLVLLFSKWEVPYLPIYSIPSFTSIPMMNNKKHRKARARDSGRYDFLNVESF